jgi:2-keto-4-pentenoate hydratase/2-oxohepta-3-ene-1,7-dioic acid hydratase in catechol pathway
VKLLCTERAPSGAVAFSILGDNALLRENEDFYIPPHVTRLSALPQLVLRVAKLGKAIAPRFAHRYAGAIGIAVRLHADNLLDHARREGLPPDIGVAFDHAVAVSPLVPVTELPGGARLRFALDGVPVLETTFGDLPLPLDEQIALLSTHCLLKVGDLILCGNTAPRVPLRSGSRVTLSLEDSAPVSPISFTIR